MKRPDPEARLPRRPNERILRHVTYAKINDYLLLGWIALPPSSVVDYHDQWGITMEWLCQCCVRDMH